HTAMFAAPFALIGAVFAEWQRIGGWLFYALIGIAIAPGGFAAQSLAESGGGVQGSIRDSHAVGGLLVTGGVSGLLCCVFAGRLASPRNSGRVPAPNAPGPSLVPQAGKPEGTSAGVAS